MYTVDISLYAPFERAEAYMNQPFSLSHGNQEEISQGSALEVQIWVLEIPWRINRLIETTM